MILFKILGALWFGIIWGVDTGSFAQGTVIFALTFWIIDIYLNT